MKNGGTVIVVSMMLAGCSSGMKYHPRSLASASPPISLNGLSEFAISSFPPLVSLPELVPAPVPEQPSRTTIQPWKNASTVPRPLEISGHIVGGSNGPWMSGETTSYIITANRSDVLQVLPFTDPATYSAAKELFCAHAGQAMTVKACEVYADPGVFSSPGHASLSTPSSMYRGQTGTVRFAVVADPRGIGSAGLVASSGAKTVTVKDVRFGTIMEARLYGEGFTITPARMVRIDAEETGEARWVWTITPVRATRHTLRIEGWVLRQKADGTMVRALPIHHPEIDVVVPIRWFPEWVHDLMDDSQLWFADGANWAKALSGFVAGLAILWTGLRTFGWRRGKGSDLKPVAV